MHTCIHTYVDILNPRDNALSKGCQKASCVLCLYIHTHIQMYIRCTLVIMRSLRDARKRHVLRSYINSYIPTYTQVYIRYTLVIMCCPRDAKKCHVLRSYINSYIHTYTHTYICRHYILGIMRSLRVARKGRMCYAIHIYIHTRIHVIDCCHTYIHTYIHNTYMHTYIHTQIMVVVDCGGRQGASCTSS